MARRQVFGGRHSVLASVTGTQDLALLMHVLPQRLALMASRPAYKVYHIPKKDGSQRLIEDPDASLKQVLRQLKDILQQEYGRAVPKAVHGFCGRGHDGLPRSVLTNAQAHVGNPYMLNMDIEDFFHSVTYERVTEIFKKLMPRGRKEAVPLAAKLTTFNGRLPMGSPTSPVLSNFALHAMDEEMDAICTPMAITYSRYVDDLTFSSQSQLATGEKAMLADAVKHHGFRLNHEKTKLYGPAERKVVTGLWVDNNEVRLQESYTAQLKVEIERLRAVNMVEGRYRTGMSGRKLALFEQELAGKLAFAQQVLGADDEEYMALSSGLQEAMDPMQSFESADWLDIPYTFF